MSPRRLVQAGLAGFAALNLVYLVTHVVETARFLFGGEPLDENPDPTPHGEPLGPAIWLAQAVATLSLACLAVATLGLVRRGR